MQKYSASFSLTSSSVICLPSSWFDTRVGLYADLNIVLRFSIFCSSFIICSLFFEASEAVFFFFFSLSVTP
ncbi:hypothetical protein HanIR_Chr08g0356101 [Helianthus annuus]|nr:hypothetical protein HanIR_Chr08g0356101 [Helianthus annuus]